MLLHTRSVGYNHRIFRLPSVPFQIHYVCTIQINITIKERGKAISCTGILTFYLLPTYSLYAYHKTEILDLIVPHARTSLAAEQY